MSYRSLLLVLDEVLKYLEKYAEDLRSEFPQAKIHIETPLFIDKLSHSILGDELSKLNFKQLHTMHKTFQDEFSQIDAVNNNLI